MFKLLGLEISQDSLMQDGVMRSQEYCYTTINKPACLLYPFFQLYVLLFLLCVFTAIQHTAHIAGFLATLIAK